MLSAYGVSPSGGALAEELALRREGAGGERAGEDHALDADLAGGVEHVPHPVHVGRLVGGIAPAGEVVVAGEVEESAGSAARADRGERRLDLGGAGDVGLVPMDPRPGGGSGEGGGAAGDRVHLGPPGQRRQEMAADEAGGARHHEPSVLHPGTSAVSCDRPRL
ncbi:MAG: hypothetical protein M5U13_04340 [Thermoanaerobaculia bacterium]|nr:hypothetical protein [Thermoanaerobaculia bacterium]